jgi:hypothetical protein
MNVGDIVALIKDPSVIGEIIKIDPVYKTVKVQIFSASIKPHAVTIEAKNESFFALLSDQISI